MDILHNNAQHIVCTCSHCSYMIYIAALFQHIVSQLERYYIVCIENRDVVQARLTPRVTPEAVDCTDATGSIRLPLPRLPTSLRHCTTPFIHY